MVKHYDLGFTKVEVYNNYIVNTIAEGFLVMPRHNSILLDFVKEHFNNKDFIYVSNRINSYSVNPTVYYETKKIQNPYWYCCSFNKPQTKTIVRNGRIFLQKEYGIF